VITETTLPRLDFLCIGAAKAGTTSLFHYMKNHPEIYLPAGKEEPFFDNDPIFQRGWDEFARDVFKDVKPGQKAGKITPRYFRDKRVAERIFQLFPSTKLIALLRDPVERAFSHYKMLKNLGREKRTFRELIEFQSSFEVRKMLEEKPMGGYYSILAQGEYGRILNHYYSLFDRENIMVLFTEDLNKDPGGTLRRLFHFLGVREDYVPENIDKKFNKSGGKIIAGNFIRKISKIPIFRSSWHLLSADRRKKIYLSFYNEWNINKTSGIMDGDCREDLVSYYRDDVNNLKRLISTPIPWQDFN